MKNPPVGSPEKDERIDMNGHFQLCYSNLLNPFTPEAYRRFQYVGTITVEFTKSTAVYLLANKSIAFDFFHLFITSVVIPCRG